MSDKSFLLDADAFIRSQKDHYGFDFCPGYWDAILTAHDLKKVASIIPVRKELLKGNDSLADWIKDRCPKSFFRDVKDIEVQRKLTEINSWVMANQQYSMPARQQFLRGADPWLIAYASVNGYVVATYEVAAPESKAKVKLPDVADEFDVECSPPFEMLRALGAKMVLAKDSFK